MPVRTQGDAIPGRLEERPQIPCSEECLLRPGNTNCGGCGMSVGLTMLGRALVEAGDTCSLVIPACCGIVTAGGFPTTSYGVPVVVGTHPIPEKYRLAHKDLPSWPILEGNEPLMSTEEVRKAYD